MKDAGFEATAIATAVKTVFSLGAQVADIFKSIGYSAQIVGNMLKSVFNETATGTATVLKAVGFSAFSSQDTGQRVPPRRRHHPQHLGRGGVNPRGDPPGHLPFFHICRQEPSVDVPPPRPPLLRPSARW